MRKLDPKTRATILHLLCEGQSIRAVARVTSASKNTITKLLVDAGKACIAYNNEHVRNVQARRVQVDEIWSFYYPKQKNVETAKVAPADAGDVWTWTAINADTKLILSYLVGGRDSECAMWFMDDLRSRLANRVQLTSHGHPDALEGRCSPAKCVGARRDRIEGNPDPAHVSTSYVERNNLTLRMHMRRFTLLTNTFSKKVENHAYFVALHMMYYNFVRLHSKLRMTPATAAGGSNRLWEIGDIVKLVEDAEPALKKRGPYKKKAK